jgi:hypothetical protein
MNEKEIERALKQLRGPLPDDDELFVAQVRKRYEARKLGRRWRLPLATFALAAAAALLALVGPHPVIPSLAPHAAPSHLADDADYLDEDPCELIGELDHDEVLRVSAQYKNGV